MSLWFQTLCMSSGHWSHVKYCHICFGPSLRPTAHTFQFNCHEMLPSSFWKQFWIGTLEILTGHTLALSAAPRAGVATGLEDAALRQRIADRCEVKKRWTTRGDAVWSLSPLFGWKSCDCRWLRIMGISQTTVANHWMRKWFSPAKS